MIELEIAGARHQIFVLHLELWIEQIEAGAFDVATSVNHHHCALGTWLYGAGLAFGHLPAYERLVREHERFHQHAGSLVMQFMAGNVADARAIQSGPFAEASRAVSDAIACLKQTARTERESQAPGGETASGLLLAPDAAILTGISLIDTQHREITEIIIRLLVHPHEHLGAPLMTDTLRELGALIALHFESEELFMKHVGLPAPELEAHQREHAELLSRYQRLAQQPEMHDAAGPCDVCLAVEQWMTDHIHAHDLALRAYAHIPYP